jgi:uncharacterized protein YndB with AHSA1/START domain
VTTDTFDEADERTTVRVLVQHSSRENRDAHVNSGMEDGLQDAMDHLEEAV